MPKVLEMVSETANRVARGFSSICLWRYLILGGNDVVWSMFGVISGHSMARFMHYVISFIVYLSRYRQS